MMDTNVTTNSDKEILVNLFSNPYLLGLKTVEKIREIKSRLGNDKFLKLLREIEDKSIVSKIGMLLGEASIANEFFNLIDEEGNNIFHKVCRNDHVRIFELISNI